MSQTCQMLHRTCRALSTKFSTGRRLSPRIDLVVDVFCVLACSGRGGIWYGYNLLLSCFSRAMMRRTSTASGCLWRSLHVFIFILLSEATPHGEVDR
mmetsp:Transcript_24255/g.33912  ORF Transcript_24255/g.33912 Transcript_24255/m.33912 type:complete len:97 (+) Transcript_24255:107-397(+)